jgi:hypothetical protein
MLEPYDGKLSRTVLRGLGDGNIPRLPDKREFMGIKIIPIINGELDRKKSIIENTPAIFEIRDNPSAVGTEPITELDSQSEVAHWCGLIILSVKKHGVDSRLAMAIMYMETTHGWYDKFYPDFLEKRFPMRRSILPMNINYRYWKKLGITKELVNCPILQHRLWCNLVKSNSS